MSETTTPKTQPKKRRVILASAASLFLLLTATFLITGYFADVAYTGSVSRTVQAPADSVWSLLNDTQRFCANRHEVRYVQLLPDDGQGKKRWREHTMLAGDMRYTAIRREPDSLLVIQMTGSDFGMHGTWEFRLIPLGSKTQVTITETSYTEGLIMRSILNALGRDANMVLLQKALADGISKAS